MGELINSGICAGDGSEITYVFIFFHDQQQFILANLMAVALTLLLVQTAIIVKAASPCQVTTKFGTLTLEGIEKRGTKPLVRGRFRSLKRDGIIFISTQNSLSIMTTEKENLAQVSNSSAHIQNAVWDSYWYPDVNKEITYIQLRNHVFAVKNGITYRFPSGATIETAMGAVKRGDLEFHPKLRLYH